MTKLAIVSMVRNECDIIELFIKINQRHATTIVIVDHMSDDGTAEIIKEMAKNLPGLRILRYENTDFQQSNIITQVVNQLAKEEIVDYIVPLDADEFIASTVDEFNSILNIPSILKKDQVGNIPWQTYCPFKSNYFESKAPLFENFRKRSVEPDLYYKLIIGNEYAKDCIVAEGNHMSFSQRFGYAPITMPFSIQHVPVRSNEQIISKSIIGSCQLRLKKNRQIGEGFHWDFIAQSVREKRYDLSQDELMNLALKYAMQSDGGRPLTIDIDSQPIGQNSDDITLMHLAKPNIVHLLDKYIDKLINKIKDLDR